MFKKLRRAGKAPVKLCFDVSVDTVDHLPIPYGKVKVVWCRGDQRSGHWHETNLYHVTNGSARIKETLHQTVTLYKDAKGTLEAKRYELKIQQYDPADGGDRPLTVASLQLDMAQYAVSLAQRQPLNLRLPLRDNPAWSVLHGDVLLRIVVEGNLPKDSGPSEADNISIASGLTSEASTIQEQDLSGFEPSISSRVNMPAEARAAVSQGPAAVTPRPARSNEDRQRDLLLGIQKHQAAKAAPGNGTLPASTDIAGPAPAHSGGVIPARAHGSVQQASTTLQNASARAVAAQPQSQWSLAAAAVVDLDHGEEIVILKEERDSLSRHLEELQDSCKSTAKLHEQQVTTLKAQIAALEGEVAQQRQQVHQAHSAPVTQHDAVISMQEANRAEQELHDRERELRMAHARILDLEGQLCASQAGRGDEDDELLIEEAEAKLVAAQACILELQSQLQDATRQALPSQPEPTAWSLGPAASTSGLPEGGKVAALQQQLLAVEQQLARAETAHMSRALSNELGLSASQVQVLQVTSLRASLESERSATKHQVTSLEVELEQLEAELEREKAQSREKVAALESENKTIQEKAAVLEAHLDQLIAQVSHADKGKALQTEVEHLRAALGSERASAEQQQKEADAHLAEAEAQLDALGGQLLDARAATQEQAVMHQAALSSLQHQLAEEQATAQRLGLFEAEVGELESALAAEKASASDHRSNLEAQVEALQLALGSATRRASMADARTSISPQASIREAHLSTHDEATSPLASAAALSEEGFQEHPRAIALQSQLSILRRTVNAMQRSQAASEQGFVMKLEHEQQEHLRRVAALESQMAQTDQDKHDASEAADHEQQLQAAEEQMQKLAAEVQAAVQQAERAEGHAASAIRALHDSADFHAQERQQHEAQASELRATIAALQNVQANEATTGHLRNGLLGSSRSEQLLRELAEAGQQLQIRDAAILRLQAELDQAQSKALDNSAENMSRVQAQHQAEVDELLAQFQEAQQLSAVVSTELDTLNVQLSDSRAESAFLSEQLATSTKLYQDSKRASDHDRSELLHKMQTAQLAHQTLQQKMQDMKDDMSRDANAPSAAQPSTEVLMLRQACADLEVRAMSELDGMHGELLEMQQACLKLEQALLDSEARRERLRNDKLILEQQLQTTAGDLVEAERSLSSLSGSSQASYRTGVSQMHHHEPASLNANQPAATADSVRQLDTIMLELVTKKMELAELHEVNIKQARELRWTQQQSSAAEAKLAKLEAIVSPIAGLKPVTPADTSLGGLIPAVSARGMASA